MSPYDTIFPAISDLFSLIASSSWNDVENENEIWKVKTIDRCLEQ